jgi:hypothetical protein
VKACPIGSEEQARQDCARTIARQAADMLAEGQGEGVVLEYCRKAWAEAEAYLATMRPAFTATDRIVRAVEALFHRQESPKVPAPLILPKPTGTTGGGRRRGRRRGGGLDQ